MNIWMNLLAYKKLFYEAMKLFVVTHAGSYSVCP